MAKAAVLEDETTVDETVEPTTKQVINDGIVAVIEATGIDVQKNRYKAMRAIAFQAFQEAIEAGDFDALVERAIANIDDLPAGWEIEKPAKAEEAPKPAAKKVAAKPAAKTAAKPAARKTAAKPAATKTATTRKRPTR